MTNDAYILPLYLSVPIIHLLNCSLSLSWNAPKMFLNRSMAINENLSVHDQWCFSMIWHSSLLTCLTWKSTLKLYSSLNNGLYITYTPKNRFWIEAVAIINFLLMINDAFRWYDILPLLPVCPNYLCVEVKFIKWTLEKLCNVRISFTLGLVAKKTTSIYISRDDLQWWLYVVFSIVPDPAENFKHTLSSREIHHVYFTDYYISVTLFWILCTIWFSRVFMRPFMS